jgi:predicted naringenin-chalcone synthase
MGCFLSDFRVIQPRFRCPQPQALEWLARAHARSEWEQRRRQGEGAQLEMLEAAMTEQFKRYGCSPTRIAMRASECEDFGHLRWDEMKLFRVHERPDGSGLEPRMEFFAKATRDILARFYVEDAEPPDQLLHVTCTGYVAPGPAQLLVQRKQWHQRTVLTNVYHMGCYAAVPAVRLAGGALAAGARRADVVHTELCTLHVDPSHREPEQCIVQSLFADGFIRYSVLADPAGSPALEVLAVHEELVPDSEREMSWQLSAGGFRMTLSRDIPWRLAQALPEFLQNLFKRASAAPVDAVETVFAIHPGGPKIIDSLQVFLDLTESQVAASRRVLREHGNMSSATLPHVWREILNDPAVAPNTRIVSLAFGPGLTVAGALLRKL